MQLSLINSETSFGIKEIAIRCLIERKASKAS